MYIMKRLTSILLLAAMLATVSCGGDDIGESQDTTASGETTAAVDAAPVETGRADAKSALDASLKFDGETVTVLSRDDKRYVREVISEQTGDVVDDAIYARNMSVEERLGITIENRAIYDQYGSTVPDEIKTMVLAGDNTYDLAICGAYYSTSRALEGAFYNMLDLPHIDLEAPWYSQLFIEAATLYDTLYYLTGDLCISATSDSNASFFNKTLVENYFGDLNLYSVVDEGKWTFDYFNQLVTDVYQDLNGDGSRDEGDFYGYVSALASHPLDSFLAASEISIVEIDASGEPKLTLNSEKTVNLYEKLNKLYFENSGVWCEKRGAGDYFQRMWGKFKNSEAIFYLTRVYDAESLREFKDPYGILPIPKYDDDQENYYTIPHDQFSIIVVPANCDDPELVGAFIEEMSVQSYKTVTPAYFEVALKSKYLDAVDDARMYDIIAAGKRLDPGVIYSYSTGNLTWVTRDVLNDGKAFASYYAEKAPAVEEKLAGVAATLKELSK